MSALLLAKLKINKPPAVEKKFELNLKPKVNGQPKQGTKFNKEIKQLEEKEEGKEYIFQKFLRHA